MIILESDVYVRIFRIIGVGGKKKAGRSDHLALFFVNSSTINMMLYAKFNHFKKPGSSYSST